MRKNANSRNTQRLAGIPRRASSSTMFHMSASAVHFTEYISRRTTQGRAHEARGKTGLLQLRRSEAFHLEEQGQGGGEGSVLAFAGPCTHVLPILSTTQPMLTCLSAVRKTNDHRCGASTALEGWPKTSRSRSGQENLGWGVPIAGLPCVGFVAVRSMASTLKTAGLRPRQRGTRKRAEKKTHSRRVWARPRWVEGREAARKSHKQLHMPLRVLDEQCSGGHFSVAHGFGLWPQRSPCPCR